MGDGKMKGLKDKKILVTGATSGIGQAIAIRFAEEGAHVGINYHKGGEELTETDELVHKAMQECLQRVDQCGVTRILVQADVSKEDDVSRMFAEVIDKLGGIDVLVNNAGIQISGDSDKIAIDGFDRVLGVNLRGAYLCARAALQHFLAQDKPGIIINVSSVHQIIPRPYYASYSISKGGMQNLTRTLALEYADRKIRVNAIGPGATATPINKDWEDDPKKRAEVAQHIPMGRVGTAEEMAAVTAFLASDDAAYITGQTLFVDGGLTLYPDFRTPWSG
jgi:glucose 1-dehydrogenase